MAPQLYLITPTDADPATLPAQVMAMLSAAEFAALLVRRGTLDDAAYAALVTQMVNVGQGANCAVLVDGDAALAKRLGADGVHVGNDPDQLRDAIKRVKPAMIVGAGPFQSRHDAMSAGELDIDYVLFGALGGETDPGAAELAAWWSETFEVPAVLSDPGAEPATVDHHGAEFLALSTSLWREGQEAAKAIAAALEDKA
jgi:thiamine-phosphate pyrophosphorylase